jgi:hypothetical protein
MSAGVAMQPAGAQRRSGAGVHGTVVRSIAMNNIIYLIGLVVVVIAILSFFGLR